VAAGAAVTGLGLIFGTWLALIGIVIVVVTATGLLFEYYVGR
jgi:Cytochrome c oxidase subunit IV.